MSISFKNLCLQITAEISKITKSNQPTITFIFNALPEAVNEFV